MMYASNSKNLQGESKTDPSKKKLRAEKNKFTNFPKITGGLFLLEGTNSSGEKNFLKLYNDRRPTAKEIDYHSVLDVNCDAEGNIIPFEIRGVPVCRPEIYFKAIQEYWRKKEWRKISKEEIISRMNQEYVKTASCAGERRELGEEDIDKFIKRALDEELYRRNLITKLNEILLGEDIYSYKIIGKIQKRDRNNNPKDEFTFLVKVQINPLVSLEVFTSAIRIIESELFHECNRWGPYKFYNHIPKEELTLGDTNGVDKYKYLDSLKEQRENRLFPEGEEFCTKEEISKYFNGKDGDAVKAIASWPEILTSNHPDITLFDPNGKKDNSVEL